MPDEQLQLVHAICHRFERALHDDDGMSIESQIDAVPDEVRAPLFRELLAIELESRVSREGIPDVSQYDARFPDRHDDIMQAFSEIRDEPVKEEMPRFIGRYRIEKLLGTGGFGKVYLAYDEQLNRPAAIKVPHRNLIARRENVKAYLDEAQAVASLDHPHIVPVYDVGRSEASY